MDILTSTFCEMNLSIILHTLKMLYIKEFYFSINFRNILCQICENLNVNVISHNSCNQRSLHI